MRASDELCGFFFDPPDLSAASDPALWVKVKAEAERHGVAPLVAFSARPSLDAFERKWCDEVLKRSWRAHDRSLRDLKYIHDVLESSGVPFLALKGPVLACRHYSPAFLRKPAGDLDLAVSEEHLGRACDALMREGYTMQSSIRTAKRLSHHVVLENRRLLPVELHFRISNGISGIPSAELFARSSDCQIPNVGKIRIPGVEDELMHLVLHLVQDRFVTLFHFQEVRRIWNSSTLAVRHEATRRAAYYGFSGVFTLADAAFRSRWGEPLLPASLALPRTWLDWTINEGLYRRMESNSSLKFERTIRGRLWGRWADFQVTASPRAGLNVTLSAIMALFEAVGRTQKRPNGKY
jgi:hypothetical protein